MDKPKIIVVLGSTATGKSDLAVLLAKEFNGEVISADSRQVYKGLDIGSGKITKKEMMGVTHYLLDVVSPKKIFTVVDFQQKADKSISQILAKGKVPIIAGGTGFYIQSIVDGITIPEVKENKELRNKLEKQETAKLFETLKKLDSKRAKEVDQNNRVRIIRAIEIAKELGKVPKVKKNPKYDVLQIGLYWSNEVLKKRIYDRLVSRMKKGMVAEARNLYENGLSFKRMEELGLEYRYLAKFLKKEILREEMIEKLNTEIWHYAKRQKTWFKRDSRIKWFKPSEFRRINKVVKGFLS